MLESLIAMMKRIFDVYAIRYAIFRELINR